jgi:hypothetical protein
MSCELLDAAARADGLDLEDLRETIGAVQRCASKIVGRRDGFIARCLGATVLALLTEMHDGSEGYRKQEYPMFYTTCSGCCQISMPSEAAQRKVWRC